MSGAVSANPSVAGEVAQSDIADNCTSAGDFTISWFDADTTGTDADVRVITRKWVVKDLCDNADTVSQTITVKPSIQTSGNVTYTDPTPIEVTMKYGVCDTLIDVAFNWTNNMTGNVVVVDSTATPYMPTDHRFTAEQSPYTITWTLTDECGEEIVVTQTVTINRATVTLKADAKTKVYGASDPALTASLTGLTNGDDESVITYTLTRDAGNDVGKYGIHATYEAAHHHHQQDRQLQR